MVELDIKITAGDLYDYMMMHSYHKPSGILGSTLGAVMVVTAFLTSHWVFLIGGMLLLVYLPFTLFTRSSSQILANPSFKEPLHYVLNEEGITISQGELSETQSWDDMVKAVSTTRSIIVYTSPVNATIFPKKQMGDKKDYVIQMISTHMPPKKVRIRQ